MALIPSRKLRLQQLRAELTLLCLITYCAFEMHGWIPLYIPHGRHHTMAAVPPTSGLAAALPSQCWVMALVPPRASTLTGPWWLLTRRRRLGDFCLQWARRHHAAAFWNVTSRWNCSIFRQNRPMAPNPAGDPQQSAAPRNVTVPYRSFDKSPESDPLNCMTYPVWQLHVGGTSTTFFPSHHFSSGLPIVLNH